MNFCEAVKEMEKGNVVVAVDGTEYRLCAGLIQSNRGINGWISTIRSAYDLARTDFQLKPEETFSFYEAVKMMEEDPSLGFINKRLGRYMRFYAPKDGTPVKNYILGEEGLPWVIRHSDLQDRYVKMKKS